MLNSIDSINSLDSKLIIFNLVLIMLYITLSSYLKNSNLTVKYYETTKDTDEVVTTYSKPNDSIAGSNSNNIKLLITNNSTSSQNVAFTMKGGYITNTVNDISFWISVLID